MKLHYGIISVASITDRFLSAVLAEGDCIEAIASRSLQKARKKADAYHVKKAYASYQAVYEDAAVDIVYISVNNASHAKEIEAALRHHKHVVCEKPLALTKADAQRLFALAKEQGCFLMEAQKSLFLPVTQDLRTMIASQPLGRLHQVAFEASFPNPKAGWMHDPTQGGVVYGSASYTIEYMDYLLSPHSVQIAAIGSFEESKTCDRVSMSFLFDDVLVNSRISMQGDTRKEAVFYFERGYVLVKEYWKARSYTIVTKEETKRILYPCRYEMRYETAHVHRCIEEGRLVSPIMSDQRTILCCEAVEEIMRQLQSFHPTLYPAS